MSELTAKELIGRYVYDVTRRLPQAQRADIGRELTSLIEDMMEERAGNGKTEYENAEDVLMELGAPAKLAGKYREGRNYLIGPEYYDQYCFVLKIVLIAVTVGMVIAAIVQGIAQEATWTAVIGGFAEGSAAAGVAPLVGSIASVVGTAIANVVMGLIQGFAWVTLVFVIIERCAVKIELPEAGAGAWKPQNLMPVPTERALLKKGDSIAGIVFTVAVIILFNFVPFLMSFWIAGPEDGVMHFIPLFNLDYLKTVLPLLNVCFALGIVREVLRVAIGRHTPVLGVATFVLNMVALWISCSIFFLPEMWNGDLINQAAALNANIASAAPELNVFWSTFTRYFGCILVFAFVLDSAISLYKGIRYGRRR